MLAPQSIAQKVIAPEWSPVGAMPRETAILYAKLFRMKYPDLAEKAGRRVDRAAQVASTPGACQRNSDGTIWVKSSSNPLLNAGDTVDLDRKTCTCPDSGKGNLCACHCSIRRILCREDRRHHRRKRQSRL
jgi:hypothetical protein